MIYFFNDSGSRISCSTGEARETSFLYQRLSSRYRRGMLHAFIDRTLILTDWSDAICFLFLPKPHYLMLPGMKYWGLKKL